MPSLTKRELHLAKSFDELKKKAEITENIRKDAKRVIPLAHKLYDEAINFLNQGDNEYAYLFLYRFSQLLNYLPSDLDRFEYLKDLGKKTDHAIKLLENLTTDLSKRYLEKQKNYENRKAMLFNNNNNKNNNNSNNKTNLNKMDSNNNKQPTAVPGTSVKIISKKDNDNNNDDDEDLDNEQDPDESDEYFHLIESKELINRIQSLLKFRKILLIDIRSAKDFQNSSISANKISSTGEVYIINIPANDIIKPGLTYPTLRNKISCQFGLTLDGLDRRRSMDQVIVLDFNTQDFHDGCPSYLLADALWKWDQSPDKIKNKPLLLKGGYYDFVLHFPTFVTNSSIIINNNDDDMDQSKTLQKTMTPSIKANYDFFNEESQQQQQQPSSPAQPPSALAQSLPPKPSLISSPSTSGNRLSGINGLLSTTTSTSKQNFYNNNNNIGFNNIESTTKKFPGIAKPFIPDRSSKPNFEPSTTSSSSTSIQSSIINNKILNGFNNNNNTDDDNTRDGFGSNEDVQMDDVDDETGDDDEESTPSSSPIPPLSQQQQQQRNLNKVFPMDEDDIDDDIHYQHNQHNNNDDVDFDSNSDSEDESTTTNHHSISKPLLVRGNNQNNHVDNQNNNNSHHQAATASTSNSLSRSLSSPNIAQFEPKFAYNNTNNNNTNNNHMDNNQSPSVDRTIKPPTLPPPTSTSNYYYYYNNNFKKIRDFSPQYSSCPRILGLKNLGNTCFMNAILQCLRNTKELYDFLLSGNVPINSNSPFGSKGELTIELIELFKQMTYPSNFKHISPRDFKLALSRHIPDFVDNKQQDAHEFLVRLLDRIHGDLNLRTIKSPTSSSNDSNDLVDPELKDPHYYDRLSMQEAAISYWKYYRKLNSSIILDLFQGLIISTVQCLYCKYTSKNSEPFTCLTLPIPLPDHHNNTRTQSSTTITLQNCINLFLRPERIYPEAKWECEKCKQTRDAEKCTFIWRLPKYLIIHLKRFTYDGPWRQKITNFIDFPIENLRIDCHGNQNHNVSYSLYGVVNHIGSLEGGHYIAISRSKEQNIDWHRYDDQDVTPILSTQDIVTQNAYVLFYKAF